MTAKRAEEGQESVLRNPLPQPQVGRIAFSAPDIPTLAQILREEAQSLDIEIPDGIEYALAQRLARRMEQE